MFALDAHMPSESLEGINEMECIPAAYDLQRYQKFGGAYEAAGESAYNEAKRAKNIRVKNYSNVNSSNVDWVPNTNPAFPPNPAFRVKHRNGLRAAESYADFRVDARFLCFEEDPEFDAAASKGVGKGK